MGSITNISEAASLAFHSMALLAKPDAQSDDVYLTVKDISLETGSSHAHLSKVLQRLAKAGLVRSTTGPRGGYALARPADQITLLNIYEAIEGPIELPDCLLRRERCIFSKCLLDGYLSKATREFREYLANKRLSAVSST